MAIPTPSPRFVHLHLHTEYSLLDGAIRISQLAKQVKEYGMPAVAMTDHGNMFGTVEFYQTISAEGLKPILGCEVYIQSKGSRFTKEVQKGYEPYNHLTLLAADAEGYKNLCRLITAGFLEGFYYKPRIDKEILREYSRGLIALSGCLSGEVCSYLQAGRVEEARKAIIEFRELFGDRYYLEAQANHLKNQLAVNKVLLELAHELDVPAVATNDCHYLHREDARAHEALLCIQTGKTLTDPDRMKFDSDDFYLKSPAEILSEFSERPDVLERTVEIAGRCHFELDCNKQYFPKFRAPEDIPLEDYLEKRARAGLSERLQLILARLPTDQQGVRVRYERRLEEELAIIRQMGFAGYFLIVADFINYAKSHGVAVGPGRGSAAGSLVAYALRITDIDPIPYGLLFERFLNPERISMPDMDIDFCMFRRDEVIRYVREKYGDVSQIITFGKMKAKAVIRDVGRVLGMPYGEVDKIAKLVPNSLGITLGEARRLEPRLGELEKKDSQIHELMRIADRLEGLVRHASTHAAGIVISGEPLVNHMPLYKGTNGDVVTQFDMKAVETIGLIKFDFLGLKTLSVIDQACKIIKRTQGVELVISDIPPDDAKVYEMLGAGDTGGVFQLESAGMRDLISKMKPTVFADLIALVALYRPGPLGSGMVDDFIKRKHGQIQVTYPLPELKEILADTYGVIVYQEQVMKIASILADFSLGEADILRRAMGKKKKAEMTRQKKRFVEGSVQKGFKKAKAEEIFNLMAKFAEYGFNKSHSAAYALISYQTAYLKVHYPVEYLASVLTHEMGNTDKIMYYIHECRDHDISILPPDINESYVGFTVVGERKIRFGLAAVKNVGEAAIESIIGVRKKINRFDSLLHFCEAIDLRRVNRRVLESLIKCGAFDSTGIKRSQALAILDQAMEAGARHQKEQADRQASMFEQLADGTSHRIVIPSLEDWSLREKLAFEKEALGFYISGHPLAEYRRDLELVGTSDTVRLKELTDRSTVTVGGMVSALREITTKKGDRMAFVTLEDLKGVVEVIVFPDLFASKRMLLAEEEPIVVSGSIDVTEENRKIVAREIVLLLELQRGEKRGVDEVHICLQAPRVSREQLERLRRILEAHRGFTPTYLHLTGADHRETVLTLPEELSAQPSEELMRAVDQLFGAPVTRLQ